MLEPGRRSLFWDLLAPPEGYEFSEAIGTSFSVDLVGAATVPVAFAFRGMGEQDGRPAVDPLGLLEALRRHADGLTLFCQAGQISVPPHDQLVYSHLEGSVVEVTAPAEGGVFHPKVWMLRYREQEGEGVRYRVLFLSRNLTFDRSWDVALALEGGLTSRSRAFARNHELGDFVSALPSLAVGQVAPRTAERVDRIQHEIRRADLEPPEGVDDFKFWPLGHDGRARWPFEGRVDRMLVVSPFLSRRTLARLRETGERHVLVSRARSIDELGRDGVAGFATKILDDAASEPQRTDEENDEETNADTLQGLHAKLYVADAGWDASLWVGSANATDAAFARNVEFLTQLIGSKSRLGVDQLAGGGDQNERFGALLVEYQAPEEPEPEPTKRALERELDHVAEAVATAGLTARVVPQEGGRFAIRLEGDLASLLPSDAVLTAWPSTLRREAASLRVDPGGDLVATFEGLTMESLTTFFAFAVEVEREGETAEKSFVINLPLIDEPEGRREAVLRAMLASSRDVLRYLLFLLRGDNDPAATVTALTAQRTSMENDGDPSLAFLGGEAVFESLVRAAHRDPARLERVSKVLQDLQATEEGKTLIPAGLLDVVFPILDAPRGEKDG